MNDRLNSNDGYLCWLNYAYIQEDSLRKAYAECCSRTAVLGDSPLLRSARAELLAAIVSMLDVLPAEGAAGDEEPGLYVGVPDGSDAFDGWPKEAREVEDLGEEGFLILESGGSVYAAGATDRGALYAVFRILRLLQTGAELKGTRIREKPVNAVRMLNHWDNLDGTVERGYAGGSLFFRDGEVVRELSRIGDYARMLASVGINAVAINNVNVHRRESLLLTDAFLPEVAKIADVFRAYGVRLFLSVNFASPVEAGGLRTADPLDAEVAEWWGEAARRVYASIPDFGGFVVKADSEFRPGPFTYGRSHADGANMLADALSPFGGLVVWRCFVYNCRQDWRDRSTDRARAAYDHFMPLDGRFRDNVLLQIKNGPMDFQVREPVSPLLGAMTRTNQLLELQITQEYTGQQRHLCYLVPQWKEALDFDTYALGEGSTVDRAASGALYGRPVGGIAGVANVGDDDNWTGHALAQANLFGFGRLAWNPRLGAEEIARDWTRATFGRDPQAERTIVRMLLDSYAIYESYTAPLGVGWMVNPGHHYGPNVDGYEYSMWGTYHYADRDGIGVDRTSATGTGYAGQYRSPQSDVYESAERCPDELLLFFHHVPYTHKLRSGKTVIQHIYDSHFLGAEQAAELVRRWDGLRGRISEPVFRNVKERLAHQEEHAREWRDVLNAYFYRKSGIQDSHGRTIY
ncbi:alpha-glucuronidase family glycosyl hydrolase [Cohnella hongkongensis]|uniref:Xylan alpha-1,2-glucuronidase n=1 Tax=Cohnella hongkongensis TaxID=178337 RepID=A0ABV9F6Y6_9BACL